MTCTYCNSENEKDCIYCPNCGKPSGSGARVDELRAAPQTSEGDKPTPAGSAPVFAEMPGPQKAQLAQANLCRLRKNWSEATELCIAVLREDPAEPAAHSLLGDIYRDQNRLDEAVRWYRMALDLSTNPFDQANLQKLERQIAGRNLSIGNGKPGTDPQASYDPVNGSIAGGTGALMGIAPQKWLKGITISALGFLCLFIIYLIFLPTKKIAPVPRAVSSNAQVSDARMGSDGMPPPVLGGPATLPAGEQPISNPPVSRVAGSGLPPDLGKATVPTMQPQEGPAGSTGAGPAPVKNVAPMSSGNAPSSGQLGVVAPSQYHAGEHAGSLSGGVEPARVDASNGVASIQLIAANATTPRDVLVRNLFRAARTVFSNDATLRQASVVVHSENIDGAPLLSADVDRASAMAVDPNNDDLAALMGHLRIH